MTETFKVCKARLGIMEVLKESSVVDGTTESEKQSQSLQKVVSDLVSDLLTTFPELEADLDSRLASVRAGDSESESAMESLTQYFNTVFPERFFDILYENESMFDGDETNLEFLPGVDYRVLWRENISDATRKTLWRYLQLILFATVSNVSSGDSFGDTAKLFEAINEDEFRRKLEETMSGVQEMFDNIDTSREGGVEAGAEGSSSAQRGPVLPDPEEFHRHVSSMMDGKLGTLAKEIAEETAQEWSVDMENASSVGDVFKKMMKNPTKLMDMVKGVGQKLDERIKSGDIKESELLAEASDLMRKMQDTPGLGNLQQMLGQMGLGGGGGGAKINQGAMRAHIERQMRLVQQKERIRAKAGASSQAAASEPQVSPEEMAQRAAAAEKAMAELLEMEDNQKLVFRSGDGAERSAKRPDKKSKGKKKKGKK